MTTPATTDKKRASPKKRRINPAIREAFSIQIKEGKTWKDAAEAAGLSETGLHKARQKPHIQQLYEQMKIEYVQAVEEMRAPYKARAFEHAAHLMANAKSEAVQARMVEFLAGERKGNAVNVAVQVNNHPQGYEYARPDQQVVVIRDSVGDTKSPVLDDDDT
ncbi:hypothetical protein [Tritonibacter mobilis]|uniref:hypothetical protein n=1 Tax=Tritonibacter mobilis TaxID=379347 RepID=UPI000806B5C6|nr:hypothetical protein [Tritonibacter mobilis]